MISRANGEIYLAGLNESERPLPRLATERKLDDECIQKLKKAAEWIFEADEKNDDRHEAQNNEGFEKLSNGLVVMRKSVCWRPVTPKGVPIIGPLEENIGEEGGVWVAAGHGPWGISLCLGTGKVVAEMVTGRKLSTDISGLEL